MPLELTTKLDLLQNRAASLAAARGFFAERGVLEVDPGALVRCPPLDANIDVMSVTVSEQEIGYLHTSPEYAMKKLLSEGSGDIYFIGHVYRKGEVGPRHNPEFTMAEWYRLKFSLTEMIEETASFIRLFVGDLPVHIVSYQEIFETYVSLDPHTSTKEDLFLATKRFNIELPETAAAWEQETLRHLLLTHIIEPKLGNQELTVVIDYPPEEAALACTIERNERRVAERFEIYLSGVELANGYHELADSSELRRRFEHLNTKRADSYPLDESFLEAMANLPPCSGVSVGFDRVLMLQKRLSHIAKTLPFAWGYN